MHPLQVAMLRMLLQGLPTVSGPEGGDRSTQVPGHPRRGKLVPNYGRDSSNETPSQVLARNAVKKRIQTEEDRRLLKGNYRNGLWFDAAGRYIGNAPSENAPVKFVRPRRLGTKGAM